MGASQRTKGHNFERWVAKRWRDSGLCPSAKRGLSQARSGDDVPDVDGTPYWVECKAQKQPSLFAALEQAEAASDGRPALVVAKRDRDKPVVMMRLEAFEDVWFDGTVYRELEVFGERDD